MAIRTYTIELRVDFEDEEKYDAMTEVAREAARSMVTMAMLLKDKREPQIMLSAGDMFMRDNDLKLTNEDFVEKQGE